MRAVITSPPFPPLFIQVAACIVIGVLDVVAGLKFDRRVANATISTAIHNGSSQGLAPNLLVSQAPVELGPGSLVFDFGFYNGADSRSYLTAGMRVIAIEADPNLVKVAHGDAQLQQWMNSGQLNLINAAIAPAGGEGLTKFYMNKCTQEWNSFHASIGCRSCTAPHVETPGHEACIEVPVKATSCAAIMKQYGVPSYFKLDIEGAESGCYKALSALPEMVRPMFMSGEVGDTKLVETFHELGYKSFKLVQQQSGVTGAWGRDAKDCRTGKQWRSYLGAKAELHAMLSKPAMPGDVCPGSLVGGVWYDLHASRQGPEAW